MELALPLWFEVGSFVVLLLVLAFDLLIVYKRPHIPSQKESALWVAFYVALALVFGILFQYFAIAPMRGLGVRDGLRAAAKADVVAVKVRPVALTDFRKSRRSRESFVDMRTPYSNGRTLTVDTRRPSHRSRTT